VWVGKCDKEKDGRERSKKPWQMEGELALEKEKKRRTGSASNTKKKDLERAIQ